jgi:hypothetical protein
MAYLLPRALIVVIAWGMTCALMRNLWPQADPMAFGIAGATWLTGGIAYVSYQRKLRREIAELRHNRNGYRNVG